MMHNSYHDITDRIVDEPLWFDENAVPRYCEFHPRACSDTYAEEAVLYEIECPECCKHYRVAETWREMRWLNKDALGPLSERLDALQYGDPPNYGHVKGCAGPTMVSDFVRVVEVWRKIEMEWVWGL